MNIKNIKMAKKEKDIIKSNVLIATFMDWEIDNSFPDKDRVYRNRSTIELDSTFKYNKSWDALMPVIEKIQELGYITTISSNGAGMRICDPKDRSGGLQNVIPTKWGFPKDFFRITYDMVVEFIEWYNEKELMVEGK
jgi:hypothetical protein